MKKPFIFNYPLSLVHLVICLIIFAFFAVNCPASLVQFSVLDMTGATNDVTINLKPVNNPVIYNGGFYWLPTGGTNLTTTNGLGQLNLVPGKYTAFIIGQPQSWTLNVTNSTLPISATSISSGATVYSGIQTLTGTGGIAISQPTPGTYNIDASQVSGSGVPSGGLLYNEPGAAGGYLLFNP